MASDPHHVADNTTPIPEPSPIEREAIAQGLPPVPPMIRASLAAFRRALPELLEKRPKQWVAYHGEECIGFARDSFDLYDECYRRGLKDDEFIVECVMPDVPPDEELVVPYDV